MSADVKLFIPGLAAAQSGCILNASMSGAFIDTDVRPQSLQRMRVEIRMPALDDFEVTRVLACVVRRTAIGVGVEWCETLPFAIADLAAAFPASVHRTTFVKSRLPQQSSAAGVSVAAGP